RDHEDVAGLERLGWLTRDLEHQTALQHVGHLFAWVGVLARRGARRDLGNGHHDLAALNRKVAPLKNGALEGGLLSVRGLPTRRAHQDGERDGGRGCYGRLPILHRDPPFNGMIRSGSARVSSPLVSIALVRPT